MAGEEENSPILTAKCDFQGKMFHLRRNFGPTKDVYVAIRYRLVGKFPQILKIFGEK
jgi:hypothetical protein